MEFPPTESCLLDFPRYWNDTRPGLFIYFAPYLDRYHEASILFVLTRAFEKLDGLAANNTPKTFQ